MDPYSIATQFVAAFPIGTRLKPAEFDTWARTFGLLNTPPDIPKQSDAWLAHLQRRHQLRYSINRTALQREDAFTVDSVKFGEWEVRTPATAVAHGRVASRVQSLIVTKQKQLLTLIESADWSVLPAHERTVAEALKDDIELFAGATDYHATALDAKFVRLRAKLQKALELGEVAPVNGGLKQLLEGEVEEASVPVLDMGEVDGARSAHLSDPG